jgi:two-component system, response regulator / RNA-binding antiterminator
MQDRKMTEPEAYRWLQKKAMNENRELAKVVAEFIEQHGARPAAATADRKRP